MNATVRWILIVVGLLVANALAMAFLVVASSSSRAQVIPDYYAKAVRHDEAMAEVARSRALGWTVDVAASAGDVVVVARDAAGAPLSDAKVEVTLVPRAHADRAVHATLAHARDRYRGAIATAPGLHDATIVVERAGQRFSQHALVEVP